MLPASMSKTQRRVDMIMNITREFAHTSDNLPIMRLDMETATVRELKEEIERICVKDAGELNAKIENMPESEEERDKLLQRLAFHFVEAAVAERYLERLSELQPNMPPGFLRHNPL